jgi:hypothetical protein
VPSSIVLIAVPKMFPLLSYPEWLTAEGLITDMDDVQATRISLVQPAERSGGRAANAGSVAGVLRRGVDRVGFRSHSGEKGHETGTLKVTAEALVLQEPGVFQPRLLIPLTLIRKAAIDDGALWGATSDNHRFAVYDIRSDGSGSGVLLGALWGVASSLMPPDCRVAMIDPVPAEAPNLALIFEPPVLLPDSGVSKGAPSKDDRIAGLFLRVEDPSTAHAALARRVNVGDFDHDDLKYLADPLRSVHAGNGHRAPVSSPT